MESFFEKLNRRLPLPYPHFMAFAPLDVWARMLLKGAAWRRVPARYWTRVGGGLFTSALGTVLTLPERALVGMGLRIAWRFKRTKPTQPLGSVHGSPKVVCILGYFRSGTTHLHYLMSCDARLCTPRWYQALAPQGFVLSWAFLRWFLVPFLASTRPQDDVAIGPEWPAEDDFALCNWSLSSSMPGRMVLPREWNLKGDHGWSRLHNLTGLSPAELRCWGYHVWAFAWKIAKVNRDRGVLLKNPSHTGRVRELVRVFGTENIKFVHLSRDAGAVVRSNVAMHQRFGPYLLQDHVGDQEVRRRIIEEYEETERRFLAEAAELPPGTLARMRYQDLVADPISEMRRVYAELGMAWTDDLHARLATYLASVRDYRAAGDRRLTTSAPEAAREPEAPAPAELAWMREAFGHDRPTISKREVADQSSVRREGLIESMLNPMIACLLWATAWIGVAKLTGDRLDWLTWPTGVVLGSIVIRSRGRGSVELGLFAASLTILTLTLVAYPATALVFYAARVPMPWGDVWDSTRDGMMATNNLVWLFLGIVSAYRLASRKQLVAPGG